MTDFNCEVRSVGSQENTEFPAILLLRNTDGDFPGRDVSEVWFHAVPSRQREILAVALTAMSIGYRVRADVDSTDDYAWLRRLFINKP
jgi:hypothetical protein